MAKYIGPVCKLCRREGEKLFLKGERCFTAKCAFDRRGFAPGQHGRTGAAEAIAPLTIHDNCAPSRKPAEYMAFTKDNSAASTAWLNTAVV